MNFVVFFPGEKFRDYPFTIERFYYGYKELFKRFKKEFPDIELFVARNADLFKNGKFHLIWKYKNQRFVKCKYGVKPDVVWNRDHYSGFKKKGNFIRLNPLEMEENIEDKWYSYRMFNEEISQLPKTVLLTSVRSVGLLEKEFSHYPVIIKARRGFQSKFVKVVTNSNEAKIVISKIKDPENYIAQEYKASYILQHCLNPIKKNLDENDFKDGQIEIRGYVTPQKIDVSTGKIIILKNKKAIRLKMSDYFTIKPSCKKEMSKFVKRIDNHFKKYKYRFYAVDIALDNKRRVFFYELNAIPAIPTATTKQVNSEKYYSRLIKIIGDLYEDRK